MTALGFLQYPCYVKILDEMSRALHAVRSHLYHRRLVQKAPDSEQVFYAHTVSMAAQRVEQRGAEIGTGWRRGMGLQRPGSPSPAPRQQLWSWSQSA